MAEWTEYDGKTPCGKDLEVLFSNSCARLPEALGRLADLYWAAPEEHRFFGLDLEYTANQQDVAVIQIAFKETVLVFQWSSSSRHCPDLVDFLVYNGFDFCSVDITQDRVKLARIGVVIPEDHYIDLQTLIQFTGPKTGMAAMASYLIHPLYHRMKTDFHRDNHNYWEETPLRMTNLKYAAIDAYVAYELFRIYSAGP